MRTTLTLLTIVAALVAVPALAVAQPNATLILTSGERVRGLLMDMGGVDFEVSVNGDVRSVPRDRVAVIDFATDGSNIPVTETARMQAGRTLFVMRGGNDFYGSLVDISSNTFQITVGTPDGERQVAPGQVSRILLRPWEGMPTAVAQPPAPSPDSVTGRYTLAANQRWVNTRLMVRQGQMVRFRVDGEIQLSGDSRDTSRPGGVTGRPGGRGAPMPAEPVGAFIGRIGENGRPFGIGGQTQPIPMPGRGILWVGINDNTQGNNSGQYTVEVWVQP